MSKKKEGGRSSVPAGRGGRKGRGSAGHASASSRARGGRSRVIAGDDTKPAPRGSRKVIAGNDGTRGAPTAKHVALQTPLPKLPNEERLRSYLLDSSMQTAEEYIKEELQPATMLMSGVGLKALYTAIQFGNQLDLVMSSSRGRYATLLGYLGVNANHKRRLKHLFDRLFGLPDAEIAGPEARKLAHNRHGRYAKAVENARKLGIEPGFLAMELERRGGVDGLADCTPEESITITSSGDAAAVADGELSADFGAKMDDAEDGAGIVPISGRRRVHARGGNRGKLRAEETPGAWDSATDSSLELAIEPDLRARLERSRAIAVLVVNCAADPIEVIDGHRLPKRAPQRPRQAARWVHETLAPPAPQDRDADGAPERSAKGERSRARSGGGGRDGG